MIKFKDGPTWYCDVDDTLVMWGKSHHPEAIDITCFNVTERLVPHRRHIDMLKQAKFRGHTVVVWSQGGSDWAEAVVKALGIESYVDLVIPKPSWYIDDLQASAFMTNINRVYLNDYEKQGVVNTQDPHQANKYFLPENDD